MITKRTINLLEHAQWTLQGSFVVDEYDRIITTMPSDERGHREGVAITHAVNIFGPVFRALIYIAAWMDEPLDNADSQFDKGLDAGRVQAAHVARGALAMMRGEGGRETVKN